MKNEFVPHEQALALKELGFDEPCFGYYYTTNGKDWKFAEKAEFYRLDDEMNIGGKFSLLAPTYSQSFRSFREKYGLISYIHPLALLQDTKKWCYEITNFESSWDEDSDLHTLEEAELACLIKLIEIVKDK